MADAARRGVRSPLTPALAFLAALVVAMLVSRSISATIPFDSDEANHANIGLRQFQDLRDGRWLDFVRHSVRTGQFPFFHGWTLLPSFAVYGTTVHSAREAQFVHFVLGAGLTAYAAWRACGGDRRAGGIAGWLFVLSPLLAALSGLCMLETPGAATTALSLACFAAAQSADGRRARVLDVVTAFAVLATWFTKLNYGIWILPAIGLGYLVPALRRETRRAALLRCATYVGTLVLVLGAWYSVPSQRAAFHGFLTNPAQAVPVVEDDPTFRVPGFRWENFTAYFGLVAREFHVHWTVGAAVLVLFVAGAWRAVRERNAVLVAAAACALWTWISLSMGFREYALARFVASALPAIWIVAAAGASPLLARLGEGPWVRFGEHALLLGGLFAQSVTAPRVLAAEYEVDDRFRPVFTWLAEELPAPASVMVVNYTDHVSPRTLVWELATRPGASYRERDVTGLIAERIYESDAAFTSWMTKDRPWGDPSWGSFVVEMVPGPDYEDLAVLVPETVVLWASAVARATHDRLELSAERRFPEIDLTVRVWRDRTPPPHVGHGD